MARVCSSSLAWMCAAGSALGAVLSGCSGDTVTLGRAPRAGELILHLASPDDDENPSLTADLLELYFSSDREGGEGDVDLWVARRASPNDPFGEPTNLSELNTEEFESSPAVSADGLTLWFGSDREGGAGGTDVWVARRESRDAAWGEATNVSELSSEGDDIPRPLGAGDTVMPLARRDEGGVYLTYFARRASVDEPFDAPVLVQLAAEGVEVVDAWLNARGDELWFKQRTTDRKGDLFVARADASGAFLAPKPAPLVNTAAEERDPWLSADGSRLFFASDREGSIDIFELELSR